MASISRGFVLRKVLSKTKSIDVCWNQNEISNPLKFRVQGHIRTSSGIPETRNPRVDISFDEKLKEQNDIEGSLKLVESKSKLGKIDAFKLISHIGVLTKEAGRSKLSPEDIQKALNDERFQKVGNVLHNNVDKLMTPSLLNLVEILLELSTEDTDLIKSLETQLLWLLKTMPIPLLIKVIQVHKEHKETPLRQQVLLEAVKWTEKRWVEISRAKDVLYLMYHSGPDNTEFLENLEERVFDVCETMSDKELYRTITLLSKRKNRNTPLLKKITYQLAKRELNLNFTQIQNLLFSCVNLSLYNKRLLDNITDVILENVAEIKDAALASGFLKSCGLLRWDKYELIDALAQIVVRDMRNLRPQNLTDLILACGTIDYLPKCITDNIGEILEKIKCIQSEKSRLWLDIVWSCVVLKVASPDMIASVLEENFTKSVTEEGSPKQQFAALKLKQIEASAKHEMEKYQGPWLHEFSTEIQMRSKRPLVEKVTKVLSNMAPHEKYLRFDVPTSSGFTIDIELAVDEKLQPVVLREHSNLGINRIAFRILDFNDVTLGTQRPTGHNALSIRLIEHEGYHVIKVPYDDFLKHQTEIQKLQYLQKEIKTSIASQKKTAT